MFRTHTVYPTSHPLTGTMVCKNNFFNNPLKVFDLAAKQQYTYSGDYPGKRTGNLLDSTDSDTKSFALFFAKKLATEIYPGMSKFMLDVRFHINDVYSDDSANHGWIHSDECQIAGLVYLNKQEHNFVTGTSIFTKNNPIEFETQDFSSRQEFNRSGVVTEEYLTELSKNHKQFTETIRFGNSFNRLVSYDAKLFHRPNNYVTNNKEPRTSLLFFINDYQYEKICKVNIDSQWVD